MADRGPFRLIPYFASLGFDRAAPLRADDTRLDRLRSDPATRFAVLWRGRHLVTAEAPPVLARLTLAELGTSLAGIRGCYEVFLGCDERGVLFGLDLSPLNAPPAPAGYIYAAETLSDFAFDHEDAALAARLKGLADWRAANRFSAASGLPNVADRGGYRLTSPDGQEHFPRVDPVAMALPVQGERVLLASTPDHPRLMTALSGAVEPGETVEQAAARAIRDRLGVRARRLNYYASQPWPVTGAIVMGFHLQAENADLALDSSVAEARWLSREDVFRHSELGFDLPDAHTLAGHLLKRWMKCGDMFGYEEQPRRVNAEAVPDQTVFI